MAAEGTLLHLHFDTSDPNLSSSYGSPKPQFNLTDFPNEIVLHILSELADEDLYTFVFLSRRMHILALPLYLARRNFGPLPHHQLVLYDYNAEDALRALSSALFKVRLRSLHFFPNCEKPIEELRREIRKLKDLVRNRLEALEDATIEFLNTTASAEAEAVSEATLISSFSNNGGFGRRNVDISLDLAPELSYGIPHELKEDFVGLLQAIMASGCKSLKISHSGSQIPAIGQIKAGILGDFGDSGPRPLLRRMYWHFQTQFLLPLVELLSNLGIRSGGKKQTSTLQTFYLYSPMAFHPHLSHWTVKTLNSSHISALSISQQLRMDEECWRLILPCIRIPSLSDLSLDSCLMRFSDLVRFLARHGGIQRLALGQNLRLSFDASSSYSNISLPSLTHMSAPPQSFMQFLGPTSYISSPALSSITILLRIGHHLHFHRRMLDDPLSSAFFGLKALKEVHLSLSFTSIPASWDVPSQLRIENDSSVLPVFTNEAWHSDNDAKVHWLITHLELDLKVYSLPLFSLAMKLPGLVRRFPNLRHLRIFSLSKDEGHVEELGKDIAIRFLLSHCPQLDSVNLHHE